MSTHRSVSITIIGSLATPAAAIVVAPVLAQSLGTEGRGFAAAATAPLLIATSAATLGLPEALTYFRSRGALRTRRAVVLPMASLFVAGCLSALATWSLSGYLSDGNNRLALVMSWLALLAGPTLVVYGFRGLAMGQQKWWRVTLERVTGAGSRLGAIVLLVLFFNLTPTSAATILSATVLFGGLAYLGLPMTRKTPVDERNPSIKNASVREVHAYGARIWLGSIAGILLMRVDQLLLTPLAGLKELGLYIVAVNIAELALIFNSSVREVVFSQQSSETNDDALARASRVSTTVTVGVALGLGLLSPFAIPMFFGDDFEPAVIPTLVLLLGVVIGNPGSVVGAGLSARGRPELRSYSLVAAVIVNVTAVFLLVPPLGALGAAVATVLGNIISGGMNVMFFSHISNTRKRDIWSIRTSDVRETLSIAKRFVRRRAS